MSIIEKAIALAVQKHAGQVDKGNQPYILHPLRLMLKMKTPEQQIVAVLHDILEDTDTTVVDLISLGFSQEVIEAIQALTKKENESRIEAAYRAVKNPIARTVKLADITDNMDLTRIPHPSAKDLLRLEEYKHVQQILLSGA
ncbi:HD domain-containing protein [Acinetobacter silvestris]|uniref:Guanosine-3',5'-bis(Diphosphate) 3'-pyrophosphohydrolase n=1 Tax=Acinetobacter silvestris TaxID=1977882 RepID=A0A1Y3CGK8_9GAMM|nr:HD domain-containing protein [Acinetobacter silvestris]OTG65245.1 guanosine-3',5'-bis(diphosphate) 3'-pyrophosphohydrolase [Acinetobacter silvestris]